MDTQALWVSCRSASLLVWHVNYPIFEKALLDSRSLRRRSTHSHNLELIWLRRAHTRTERKKVDWGFEITGCAPRLISFFLTLDCVVMTFPYEKRKICSKNEQSKSYCMTHQCYIFAFLMTNVKLIFYRTIYH